MPLRPLECASARGGRKTPEAVGRFASCTFSDGKASGRGNIRNCEHFQFLMYALLKFPTSAQKIEEATEKGKLTELVLMVIWNRLDLARRDLKKDVIRSLDLLYRRVEAEILKREATPAMRLLNDLLNIHDGYDGEGWLKECKKRMVDTFP
ncbi:unnamed protein product [Prunus armeniaca]|uniref:Uncharacterized protein n=1 Tax=Prunus armeniaca TaxID=36596 RepID=A0A6J5W298_PRUAR|nr:unnamed protein product [Prunus armeniaca]